MSEGGTSAGGDTGIPSAEQLKKLLDRGNLSFSLGDSKGAIRHFDSALGAFVTTQHIVELRPLYQRIWASKALAHQQLKEHDKAREAAGVASSLADASPSHEKQV